MDPRKAELVDIAARAEYESVRCGVTELQDTTWATLPEHDGSEVPSPRCKEFYRQEVFTTIEALWRAGVFIVGPSAVAKRLLED